MKEIELKNKVIYSIDELKELGLSPFRIRGYVKSGKLVKLSNVNYLNENSFNLKSQLLIGSAMISGGIVSLKSAAWYFGLCDEPPTILDISVDENYHAHYDEKIMQINVKRFAYQRYILGQTKVVDKYDSFMIYNMDKTVLDLIVFNKYYSVAFLNNVINRYLKNPKKNLSRLYSYANKLDCMDLVNKYIGVE